MRSSRIHLFLVFLFQACGSSTPVETPIETQPAESIEVAEEPTSPIQLATDDGPLGPPGEEPEEGPTEPAERVRVSLSVSLQRAPSPGNFDDALVHRMFRARARAVARCLERHDIMPRSGDTHVVGVRIDERGMVQSATAATEHPGTSSCAVNTARRLRWNPGPVGGVAEYVVTFTVAVTPR